MVAELEFGQQRELLRSYLAHIDALSSQPIASLDTAVAKSDPGPSRVLRIHYTEEQTRAFDRSVRRRAKLADTSVTLWAAARLLDRLQAHRGEPAPRQVIPVPMSLDPKAETERMFGNDLTMLMMSLERADLADEARAIAALAEQRREIVKQQLDRAAIVAMRLVRPLPSRIYDWVLTHPFGGERASQLVSNPGRIDIETFCGCVVSDAYPMPVAVCPPGLQIVTSRHAGRFSVFVVYREALVTRQALLAETAQFERDLSGGTNGESGHGD
jgi:hypothetical protein